MSPIVGSLANGSTQGYGGLRSFAPDTAFDSIATFTGNGTAATYTFSNISGTYKSLQLRVLAKSTNNPGAGGLYGDLWLKFRVNGDTGTNYATHKTFGTSQANTYTAGPYTTNNYFHNQHGLVNSGPSGTSIFGATLLEIVDYASTSKYKTITMISGADSNALATNQNTFGVGMASGLWLNTSAITSLTVFTGDGTNFATGTSIALYGVQ